MLPEAKHSLGPILVGILCREEGHMTSEIIGYVAPDTPAVWRG